MNETRSGVDWRSAGTDGDRDPRVGIVAGVVSVAVLAVAFGLLALDQWWFWIAFPIGYGGVLPLATAAAAWAWSDGRSAETVSGSGRREPADADEDAVAAVERQYVEGRLDEAAFERELEAALEREGEFSPDRGRDLATEREGRRE